MVWGGAAVSEEDRLRRGDMGHIVRRTARMLGRQRRTVAWSSALIVVFTLCVLAGPLPVPALARFCAKPQSLPR